MNRCAPISEFDKPSRASRAICAVTDDGVQCAVEDNCVRWGRHDLPPQAGIAVFARSPDGLLVAARVYDDVEPPVNRREV
jgi:hypothetical protein